MKIGILGGSFNPPQNAHLNIGISLVKENILDKVIYIPNIINPIHNKKLVSPLDRFNMVKKMVEDYPFLEVSNIDIKKEKQNYSYQTIDELKKLYKSDELYLIIGSDNLKEIQLWSNYEYLISNNKIIIIKRNTDNISEIINNNINLAKYKRNFIEFNNIKEMFLSSTLVREKIINKEDFISLIPEKVYNYIINNNLYEVKI